MTVFVLQNIYVSLEPPIAILAEKFHEIFGLHAPSVLPPHPVQSLRDLPQRTVPHRLHQAGENIFTG